MTDDSRAQFSRGKIPIDGTLVALLVPSIFMVVIAVPAGFIFNFRAGIGKGSVHAGTTNNFFWVLLQYLPIMMSLTFATSMVYAGRVVALLWSESGSELDEKMKKMTRPVDFNPQGKKPLPSTSKEEEEEGASGHASRVLPYIEPSTDQEPAPRPSLPASPSPPQVRRSSSASEDKKMSTVRRTLSGWQKRVEKKKDADLAEERAKKAENNVARMSGFEMAQWAMLIIYFVEIILVGNIAEVEFPLWDASWMPYFIGMVVVGLIGVNTTRFTLKNLRQTVVRREGKETVTYVTDFIGRMSIALLVQHFCFFFVGISSSNMMGAFQPVALSLQSTAAMTEPCSLLTPEYFGTHCVPTLNVLSSGTGEYNCSSDTQAWHGYTNAYHACGGVTSSIQLRTMGYSATILNVNAFVYVLLKECTKGMGKMALSKMARGKSDARTSLIFTITGIALCCCPLFLAYMLISPVVLFDQVLANQLLIITALNVSCWATVALLLNAEFFLAKVSFKAEYDVFISYRVNSEKSLASDLYHALKAQGLRVFFDKVSLKDGEGWEAGFMKGLSSSAVYVLLYTEMGMARFAELNAESDCDNVLLEIRLAQELAKEKGVNHFKVFPLFLGPHDDTSIGRFDVNCDATERYPDVAVEKVEAKVKREMQMIVKQGGFQDNEDGHVQGVINWLKSIQGIMISEPSSKDEVLLLAAKRIAHMADEIKHNTDTSGGSLWDVFKMFHGRSNKGEVAPAPEVQEMP